jgi:hypothetical protein
VKAPFDPIVAEALARIAPEVDADPEPLLRRAKRARAPRRRSWALRGGALAFAGIAVAGGAALAGTKLDLVPWSKAKSPSVVRFSIDNGKRYRGPAPREVRCSNAGGAKDFTCRATAGRAGQGLAPPHRYSLAERIEAQPRLTRRYILRKLAEAESRGTVPPLLARRIRLDAEAVSNDFFAKLGVLASVQSMGVGAVRVEPSPRRAFVLVPPRNQAVVVACTSATGAVLRCRDLAAAQGVPVGAPVYMLEPSRDWPRAKREPKLSVPAPQGLVQHVFGRALRPVERRLLFELFSPVESGSAPRPRRIPEPVP